MPTPSPADPPHFFPQEQPNTCAIACLRMVLSAYQVTLTEEELARRAKTNEFGTELGELVRAAKELGFDCEAKVLEFVDLPNAYLPIVYLDGPTLGRSFLMHAVVVAETEQSVKVLDPSKGLVELERALFCEAWDIAGNYAVLIKPMPTVGK